MEKKVYFIAAHLVEAWRVTSLYIFHNKEDFEAAMEKYSGDDYEIDAVAVSTEPLSMYRLGRLAGIKEESWATEINEALGGE